MYFVSAASRSSERFSCSSMFGIASSSASSCSRRLAHDRPAVPPPTIATPTSIRSSSASVGGPTNSFAESTGGGN